MFVPVDELLRLAFGGAVSKGNLIVTGTKFNLHKPKIELFI
jgi:hypothetical protein